MKYEERKKKFKTVCAKCGTELPFECMRSFCKTCERWVKYKDGEIKEVKR